jgi:hypothetical protein
MSFVAYRIVIFVIFVSFVANVFVIVVADHDDGLITTFQALSLPSSCACQPWRPVLERWSR